MHLTQVAALVCGAFLLSFGCRLVRGDEPIDLSKYTIIDAVEDIHPDGSRTLLYKILQPPPKPKPPAPPPVLTPEEQAALFAEAQRRSGGTYSFGSTVYATPAQTPVTHVRWQHDGQHYEAWSRIDFNLLRSIGHLDIDGRYHSFFLMIGKREILPDDLPVPPGLATAT